MASYWTIKGEKKKHVRSVEKTRTHFTNFYEVIARPHVCLPWRRMGAQGKTKGMKTASA